MRVLLVHPSPLLFSEIYLRLEPLGVERVAAAAQAAGHAVELLDLQVFGHRDFHETLTRWRPDAVGFSLNYLANVPEVIDLARATRRALPGCRVFVGGHSASFVARDLLAHAEGAIDCVVRGEGEGITPQVLDAFAGGAPLESLPGVVTPAGAGPAPLLVADLERHPPARRLLRRRRRYFIGELDPCASIEFTRGCPWDCAFCSAWTFYGRSYRKISPEVAGEDLAAIAEPNVFIVDDVAFIRPEHGMAIADEIDRRRIRKRYYLETRADVLIRNREVFARWTKLGLRYMFLGIEAIDEEGLKRHRKRVHLGDNERALEIARELGLVVAINIIADPDWDERRFEIVREWALSVPEIVHMTVNTPYPGTETWLTESRRFTTRDYRLFDVQHAVLPTRLPLPAFYEQFVKTQDILNRKHLGWRAVYDVFGITLRLLARGQTNFVRMLWKFGDIYNTERLCRDHEQPVRYPLTLPEGGVPAATRPASADLFVHHPSAVALPA
ncbi:MAG TPA: hopanoid C-3 methylase HpnR [Candidatus Binatia bacterium]|nr:hopanoid C-3 methylase HpnR [Candidatus Binatia bacterium]